MACLSICRCEMLCTNVKLLIDHTDQSQKRTEQTNKTTKTREDSQEELKVKPSIAVVTAFHCLPTVICHSLTSRWHVIRPAKTIATLRPSRFDTTEKLFRPVRQTYFASSRAQHITTKQTTIAYLEPPRSSSFPPRDLTGDTSAVTHSRRFSPFTASSPAF